MNDPVPSKDVDQRIAVWRRDVDADPSGVGEQFLELLEIAEAFQRALRGIQSCSTCEACRGAATLALGGATPEPSAEQVLERGRQVEEQGLRLRHRVAEHPVPRTGYVLVWHEDKGQLFPTAWHTACYHHSQMGANLYPPAVYWEVISAPESTQPPGVGQ